MNYNDNSIISDKNARAFNNSMGNIKIQQLGELKEIRNKLSEQELLIQSSNHKEVDSILHTIKSNLRTLDRIITTAKTQNIDNKDVYGKTPSHDEIMRMKNYNNEIENRPIENSPTEIVDNPPPPPSRSDGRRTMSQRSFPMQGSILSTIVKSISTKLSNRNKNLEIKEDFRQNRFHNIIAQHHDHHDCDSNRKCVTKQVDLLRLLVLYITLQPNHYCIRPICNILNDQFDVFMKLSLD